MSAAAEQEQMQGTELDRLWSVTTLLDMAFGAGRGLQNWIATETAAAAVDKRSTLEAMLREGTREEAIKWLADQRWASADRNKARGEWVHRWAESIALDAPMPLLEPEQRSVAEPYVEQLVRWLKTWQPRFVLAEAPVYNLTHRYAGTTDGIFELPGHGTFLFDYKTTPKGPDARSRHPYAETPLQIAAYAHAEEVGVLKEQRYTDKQQRYYLHDPIVEHAPMPHVDGAICVVISPYDCVGVPISIGDVPWATFRYALECARWNETGWRKALGAQMIARPE